MTSSASCLSRTISRAVATVCWLCVCAHLATAVAVVVLQAAVSHPLAREIGSGLERAQRAVVLPWVLVGVAVAAFRTVQPALRAVQTWARGCWNCCKRKKVKTAPPPERDEPPKGPPKGPSKGPPKGPSVVKRKRNTKRAYPTL